MRRRRFRIGGVALGAVVLTTAALLAPGTAQAVPTAILRVVVTGPSAAVAATADLTGVVLAPGRHSRRGRDGRQRSPADR